MAHVDKYVSVTGAGAHDGSSLANAWTFEEAIVAATAGCRVHIEKGTHPLTAARTLPTGATENHIDWVGYSVTPGDLEDVGRSPTTGQLIDTNFPVIDCGAAYNLSGALYNSLRYLTVTGGLAGAVMNSPTSLCTYFRCKLINTNSTVSASARAFGTTSTTVNVLFDCDCVIHSQDTSAICIFVGRSGVVNCRVWSANGTPAGTGISCAGIGSYVIGCVITNFTRGMALSVNSTQVSNNIWYNVGDGVLINGNATPVIFNNIGWLHSGYAIVGSATSGNPHIFNNAFGSHTSGRLDTTTLGTVIEEISPITLTADPFTNAAAGDFTLNNTAGGGALCRATSKLWLGYADLGPMQIVASSGNALTALRQGIYMGQAGVK